jgi:hypothetical protein
LGSRRKAAGDNKSSYYDRHEMAADTINPYTELFCLPSKEKITDGKKICEPLSRIVIPK